MFDISKSRLLISMVGAFALSQTVIAADGTFDADLEGSTQGRVGVFWGTTRYETWTYPSPAANRALSGGLGNTPYIYQDITTAEQNRGYGLYPGGYGQTEPASNYLGDLTGKWLVMSVLVQGDELLNFSRYADEQGRVMGRFSIGRMANNWGEYDYFISDAAVSLDLNSIRGDGWVTVGVEMVESNFWRWPNSQTNTKTFSQLLSTYNQIGLTVLSGSDRLLDFTQSSTNPSFVYDSSDNIYRLSEFAAYSTGTTRFGIDSIRVSAYNPVPEPVTLLLGAGGLAVAAIRRRKK